MWQFLVKNWLRGYATDQLYKTAAEKAKDFATSPSPAPGQENADPTASEDNPANTGPVDAGIVMADTAEAGSLIDRLTETTTLHGNGFTVHVGSVAERRVAVAISGDDPHSAAYATQAIIDGHQPAWLFAAGFANSLTADVSAGDVVLADRVLDGQGHRLQLDLNVDRASLEAIRGTHVGAVLSSAVIPASNAEDTTTDSPPPTLCADIQTFAVAEVCRQNKTPCLVVRAITKAADEQTPSDIQHLNNQATVAGKLGAATGAVWRRPSSVKDMWHDKEVALQSSKRLADFLSGMLAQLPATAKKTPATDE